MSQKDVALEALSAKRAMVSQRIASLKAAIDQQKTDLEMANRKLAKEGAILSQINSDMAALLAPLEEE
jgi:septal ring factor EnvC (AmiA/AmiB activator)